MFINDYFNLHIKSEFETYLIKNNVNIFNYDENATFIFKGGNIYFENILLLYNRALVSLRIDNNMRINLERFFSDNFSVSDFDFVISIKCHDYKKYNQIKNLLIKFTTEKLEEITLFFNTYLSKILSESGLYDHEINNNNVSYKVLQEVDCTNDVDVPANTIDGYITTLNNEFLPFEPRPNIIETNVDNPVQNDGPQPVNGPCKNNLNDIILSNFSELYNNIFFDKFMIAIKSNSDIRYYYHNIINNPNNCLTYYATLVSSFNVNKIRPIIRKMITNIQTINDWINQHRTIIDKPTNDNIYNAMLIDIISKLNCINEKYGFEIFINVPSNDKLKKHQRWYFNKLKKHIRHINFYSDEIFCNILEKIKNMIDDLSCIPPAPPAPPAPLVPGMPYNLLAPYNPVNVLYDNINIINNLNNLPSMYPIDPDSPIFGNIMPQNQPSNPKKFVKESFDKFLFNNNQDYKNEDNYKIIQIKTDCNNRILRENIKITSVQDVILITDIYNDIMYSNKKIYNYHYITFVSSIYDTIRKYIINFDLLRSKINFTLNNITIIKYGQPYHNKKINIPSEFIDISFANYNDTNNRVSSNYEKLYFDINLGTNVQYNFQIVTYDLDYFIYDLEAILFQQNRYPWLDNKYAKRLKRLFFLYCVKPTNIVGGHINIDGHLYLLRVYINTNYMLEHINGTLTNNNYNTLNQMLIYSDMEFYELCETIITNKLDILDITFCSHTFLHKKLNFFINNLVFTYQFYRVYRNIINRQRLYNLINYIRIQGSYLEYENEQYFIKDYYNKIPEYIHNIINVLSEIFNNIHILTQI